MRSGRSCGMCCRFWGGRRAGAGGRGAAAAGGRPAWCAAWSRAASFLGGGVRGLSRVGPCLRVLPVPAGRGPGGRVRWWPGSARGRRWRLLLSRCLFVRVACWFLAAGGGRAGGCFAGRFGREDPPWSGPGAVPERFRSGPGAVLGWCRVCRGPFLRVLAACRRARAAVGFAGVARFLAGSGVVVWCGVASGRGGGAGVPGWCRLVLPAVSGR
jgi:hypothetical protein